jgi:metal-sulfur cluster biosynthetic enzyme
VATVEELRDVLNTVEDPELGMGIVDLGLVYDVEIDGSTARVTHTLTSMGCPVGPYIQEQIAEVAGGVEGIDDVKVDLVWTPASRLVPCSLRRGGRGERVVGWRSLRATARSSASG